ncbi:MAG: N-acetylmuramoyl-L-alanine amidase [Gemmatimonadetes bacterium]|nr:N-acetylmuramoyl-L-alanine amidase [Gemmatimonadota bacterium]
MTGPAALAALALALQLPGAIVVRGAGRPVEVPIVLMDGAPAVRADEAIPALGGRVSRVAEGRWTLALPGATLDIRDGLPFAGAAGATLPISASPRLVAGVLVLPLQLVTELLPRTATGLTWDPARAELRAGAGTVFSPASNTVGPGAGAREPVRKPASARPSRPATPRDRRVVVVDAGHGGPDNGMHGPINGRFTIYEKDITLAVAEKLATSLRARGVRVVMTRSTDTLIALSDRGRIANREHGDLFLSVHVNAANMGWTNPGGARGFETYFLAEAKTEDARRVERMENEAIRFETTVDAGKHDALAFVINDMAQNEHLRESSELAAIVQQSLARMHPGPSRGVKQAGFRVLVTAYMPAVLIEIGFGTNPAEAHWMNDDRRQQEIAGAVADAAMQYLDRYERRVGAQQP